MKKEENQKNNDNISKNLKTLDKKVILKKWVYAIGISSVIGTVCFVNAAYADWFKVGDVKANLITPVYGLVNDNLGFVAFAVGGAATFLARGKDMYEKGLAFGIGSLGTAGAVKLAQTVLHLG